MAKPKAKESTASAAASASASSGKTDDVVSLHVRQDRHGAIQLAIDNYTTPSMAIETVRAGIVPFGKNNLFPNHSIEQFEGSPTHGAICRRKADLTAGIGFKFDGTATSDRWVKALGIDRSIDMIGQSLALDLAIHNGYCFQVIWAVDGKQIARIKYHDFSKVRKVVDADENVVAYALCRKWTESTKLTSRGVKVIKPFDPSAVTRKVTGADGKPLLFDENGAITTSPSGQPRDMVTEAGMPVIVEANQLYYFEGVSPGQDLYPKPTYLAADVCIRFDREFCAFHMNNVLNGLLPSFIVEFHGPEPEQKEKEAIVQDLIHSFKGAKGRKAIAFWNPDDEGMTLHVLDVKNNESRYLTVAKHMIDQIISGHQLSSPTLAGLTGNGGLGGNASEIETAYKLFVSTVIANMQKQLLSGLQDAFNRASMDVQVSIIQLNPFMVEATKTVVETNEAPTNSSSSTQTSAA